MFGYDLIPITDGRTLRMARPEKALIDLLYLYPFYDSIRAMEDLRLDAGFLQDELDISRLNEYTLMCNNDSLRKRVQLLKKAYAV
jgi:hypothetical protein